MKAQNPNGWSLKQGLAAQYAAQAGLDPELGAAAGEDAWDVLKATRDAAAEQKPKRRSQLLKRARQRLAKSNLSRHKELSDQIRAKLESLSVPENRSSINPYTGLQEFSLPPAPPDFTVTAPGTRYVNDPFGAGAAARGHIVNSPHTGSYMESYFKNLFADGTLQNQIDLANVNGQSGEGAEEQPVGPPPPSDQDPIEEIVVTPDSNSLSPPWPPFDPIQVARNGPMDRAWGHIFQNYCLGDDMAYCDERGVVDIWNPSDDEISSLQPGELQSRIDAIKALKDGMTAGKAISEFGGLPWVSRLINLPRSALERELQRYQAACHGVAGCRP